MAKLSIRDIDLGGKRVFIRADFNVPFNSTGEIIEDTRIRAFLPTLEQARQKGARILLASHLGRPKGKSDPKMSLSPVAARLSSRIGVPVVFVPDCVGEAVAAAAAAMKDGEVLLLENLRFHPEEEKNDPEFARQLADPAEVYINDAFGAAHRAHASTQSITRYVSVAAAGLLMERELRYLRQAKENPQRPYVAIIGGAKVSDKIEILKNLIQFTDTVLIGGAMAYTFLKARGHPVGRSLVENDKLDRAREILTAAQKSGVHVKLPVDHRVTDRLKADAIITVVPSTAIPNDRMGVDIGPATQSEYAKEIRAARTVIWNGPMGVFEIDPFAEGTLTVARSVADSSAVSIVGGGDSLVAIARVGVQSKITHISTGGGASLAFLSGLKLPGVEALSEKE